MGGALSNWLQLMRGSIVLASWYGLFVQRSHTIPSPSPSLALGTISFGNPLPPPTPPCTLDSPASTASSQDPYTEMFSCGAGSGPKIGVAVASPSRRP